jgi:hypothetical protein
MPEQQALPLLQLAPWSDPEHPHVPERHDWCVGHTTHEAPPRPHAEPVVPARQTPLGSQHPAQVAALHDDCTRHVPSTHA